MTLHAALSNLWDGSSLSKCHADKLSASLIGQQGAASDDYLSGDPWDGNADLAAEDLVEWFTDSLQPNRRPSMPDIKSVHVKKILEACWEQERTSSQNSEGDALNRSSASFTSVASSPLAARWEQQEQRKSSRCASESCSPCMSVGSASTASNVGSATPLSSITSAASNDFRLWHAVGSSASPSSCNSRLDSRRTKLKSVISPGNVNLL